MSAPFQEKRTYGTQEQIAVHVTDILPLRDKEDSVWVVTFLYALNPIQIINNQQSILDVQVRTPLPI